MSSTYIVGLSGVVIEYLVYMRGVGEISIFDVVPSLLLLLRCLGFGFPVYVMYLIVSGELLSNRNVFIRIAAFVGTYVGGLILGVGLDWLCIRILSFLASIFS